MNVVVRLLAVYRLTRLVVADKITEDARKAIQRRVPEKVAYLFGCPWCASMYTGAVVSLAAAFAPRSRLVRAGCEALAGSAIAGLVSTWLHVEEETGELLEAIDPDPEDEAEPAGCGPECSEMHTFEPPCSQAVLTVPGGWGRPSPAISAVVQMADVGTHWEHCSLDTDHEGPCR